MNERPSVATLRMVLPRGWMQIDALADREAELGRVAAKLTRHLPADSSAAARHRIEQGLGRVLRGFEEEDGPRIHSLVFPTEGILGLVLPVTVAVSAIEAPAVDLSPVEVLVGMATGNTTSTPVAIDDTVALRTHTIVPVAPESLRAAVEVWDEGSDLDGVDVYSLRVHYVFGWNEPSPAWYVVSASAMMPAPETSEALAEEYLGLFDEIVSGIARPAVEPPA